MPKWIESPANPLVRLSDERLDELGRRLKAARALANMPNRSRYDVELAAEEAGVHRHQRRGVFANPPTAQPENARHRNPYRSRIAISARSRARR